MESIVIVLLNSLLCVAGFVVSIMNYIAIQNLSIPQDDPSEKIMKRTKISSKNIRKKPIYHDEEALWQRERDEKRGN